VDGKFVAYYRVSTETQDTECAAQRLAVETYLNGGGWELLGEFVEVETGKISDRPELQNALTLCKRRKAKLVIAKLDRLSRNLHFITGLVESGVKFVACDMPHAKDFEIHIRASLAQEERRLISERTSQALQARKAQGKPWMSKRSGRMVERLGSPDPSKGSAVGVAVRKKAADEFAAKMLPVIDAIRARGLTTLQAIADELTRQRWPTAKGADAWSMMAVSNILKRRILSPEIRPERDHEHPF
jgi:DNA invertase Pin-like site-specific DNA recombinase